ncbi:MAG: cytochrome P450 [Gammaproteobacteria bacterium]|nr:cytochrome P450 [Gammaproteobacteria bacterium]MYH47283.1 cytochrome P450 [Gammaproteobacteria bacterium]MYL13700.1 cytochrome P450 [Gammaproteobacteria bacterium]
MPTDWDSTDPFAEERRRTGVLDAEFLGEKIPMILRYRDVLAAARDYGTYSSDAPFRIPIPSEERVRAVRQLPIETDPPEHTDYRAIVQPFFNISARPRLVEDVNALIAGMLDAAADAGVVEVVREFALPLQSRALALLLRMPASVADEWISWGLHVFAGPEGHSEEKGNVLDRYLHRQFDRVEAEGADGDDFFSALGRAKFRGRPLTREEMVGFANLVFAGGRDTVIAAVSMTLAHFATHAEDLRKLRGDPLLARMAAEEIVRVASPLTMIARVCPRATDIHGIDVAADGRAALCWASANRDETVFESPEKFIVDRRSNPHLAYGAGPHRCLGATHARLLLRTLIELIASKGLKMEVVESEPRYEGGDVYRRQTGYESLLMSFGR